MQSGQDQLNLLELQKLDSKLGRLRVARQTDPTIAAVATLEQRVKQLDSTLITAGTAVSDITRDVKHAQAFIDEANARIARNQQKLDAGELNHKDTLAVTEEMTTLAARVVTLEEQLLDVMERQEACVTAERHIQETRDQVLADLAAATDAKDTALAGIVAEGRAVVVERDKLAATIPAPLLQRYDALRARLGGEGAARYWGGKCEGCGLVLPPGDQEAIKKAGPEQVVTCEECGRILIRVPQ